MAHFFTIPGPSPNNIQLPSNYQQMYQAEYQAAMPYAPLPGTTPLGPMQIYVQPPQVFQPQISQQYAPQIPIAPPIIPAPTIPSVTLAQKPSSRGDTREIEREARYQLERIKSNYVRAQIVATFTMLAGDEFIAQESVVEITRVKEATELGRGKLAGTLSDPAMGPSELADKCTTCFQDELGCPTHFGRIVLGVETKQGVTGIQIYHPFFFSRLMSYLKAICRECGYSVLEPEKLKTFHRYLGDVRLARIAEASVGKSCWHCKQTNYDLAVNDSMKEYIVYERHDKVLVPIHISKVANIIKMSDPRSVEVGPERERRRRVLEDLGYVLQYNHNVGTYPKAYILTSIYVLPPGFRKAAYIEGQWKSHTITIQYDEILKVKNKLALGNVSTHERDLLIQRLIRAVHEIYSLKSAVRSRYNKIEKGLVDILQKKTGIFRRAGMGKRVDAGRSVIGAAPDNPLGTISYPRVFAPLQTKPVTVTNLNRELMQEALKKGLIMAVVRGGVSLTSERVKDVTIQGEELTRRRQDLVLNIGDVVRRQAMDGDMVIFYRAPTIVRGSLLGQRIKIWNQKNIGLSLKGVADYNADFDGDEMTLWMPDTLEAQIETEELFDARQHILSHSKSAPVAGPFYDALSGTVKLTDYNLLLPDHIFMDLLYYLDIDTETLFSRLAKYGVLPNTGRALFSAILPPDFYYDGPNTVVDIVEVMKETEKKEWVKAVEERKEHVKIRDGVLISGRPNKEIVGLVSESIMQKLVINYSRERAAQFADDLTNLTDYILNFTGLTASTEDLYPSERFRKQVLEEKVKLQTGMAPPPISGWTADPQKEKEHRQYQKEMLQKAENSRTTFENLTGAEFTMDNNFTFINVAGTKGSIASQTQMLASIGSSTLKSKRLEPSLNEGKRCSVYFNPNDYGADAFGFCYSSFQEGMRLSEYMYHQQAGREALITQANETWKVGKIRRDLIKFLEDLTVGEDFSVRLFGRVIQYLYGGMGVDPGWKTKIKSKYGPVHTFINIDETINRLNGELGY